MNLFPRRTPKQEKPIDPLIARAVRMRGTSKPSVASLRQPQRRWFQFGFRAAANSQTSLKPAVKTSFKSPRPNHFQNRRNEERKRKLQETTRWFVSKRNAFIAVFVGILTLIGAVAGVYFLNDQKVYIVSEIEVIGNVQTSKLAIVSSLDYVYNSSLLLLSTHNVEARLLQDFPYLKRAAVRKVLPGKIEVEVSERFPTMAYINQSGVFLIDDDGVVVTVVVSNQAPEFTPEEQQVYLGYGDPEAEYVRERHLSTIQEEEERTKVVWEEVPLSTKRSALKSLQEELVLRVKSAQTSGNDVLKGSAFADLPKVLSTDSELWSLGAVFAPDRFIISKSIIGYLTKSELKFDQIEWVSGFTIEVNLTEGKKLMFTSTREIEEQVKALDVLRQKVDISRAKVIDLRSQLVAVK